jgi:hypothetical protein
MHEPLDTPAASCNRTLRASRLAPLIQMADGSHVAVHSARSLSMRDRVALGLQHYVGGLREMGAEAAEACRDWCESFWMD